jgi:hypothetical protein
MVPKLSKFENKSAKYLKNLKTERFQEPRMFTMEQIRNISYACMNQSTLVDRVAFSEKKLVKLHNTTITLDVIDKQIRFESADMHK